MKNMHQFVWARSLVTILGGLLFMAAWGPLPTASALTVTAVTSDNGYPAHEVQWTDSAGLPRTAIMVDQNLTTAPYTGYLRRYVYRVNGATRTCTGTQNYASGGNLEFSGDGFVQNHTGGGGDFSSGNGSGVPGTTSITLVGTNFVMIQYAMANYTIYGPYYNPVNARTVPTTVQWFFADGRSHPIFAISQDARNGGGNLGADSRSPYGDMAYDGDGINAYVGGCSYGDTYKFFTLAANTVTTNSGWAYNQPNTIPYAMQWANPATVDAEMGHVATLPITVSDQGIDSQVYNSNGNNPLNSIYGDYRTLSAVNGPMIPDQAWAFQILNDNWPASGPTTTKRLTWGANFGRVGGYDDGYWGGSGTADIYLTNFTQHATDPVGNPVYPNYKGVGNSQDGSMMAYSVFVVFGTHTGGYTNGTVGQQVVQMQNAAQATLAATLGTVTTTGYAGVGNATNRTITFSPAGFDPTYADWQITAKTNAVNATLTTTTNYPLNDPIFVINNYTNSQLPGSISVGPGLTNLGVNYFASLDANNHRLWITVNRVISNALNLVVMPAASGGSVQPAPVVSSFNPTSGAVGTPVTITGQNLTNATIVVFNGVAAVSYTINSATQITATVPAGAATGVISVTTPGGTAASAGTFTVTVPAPVVSSFTPTSGGAGTPVTITGSNLTGATAVNFNGTASGFTVNSATQITATVPAGATTGTISVTAPGGTATSTGSFTVVLPPTIQTYPSSAAVGSPVVITGQNFTGATNVAFNGTPASFTVNSSTQITATVPAGATAGQIEVFTPGGTGYSIGAFTPLAPPVISIITPHGSSGMVIGIMGSGFTGATNVSFNGKSATFTVNDDTQITATVPAGATTGPLSIATPYGTGGSPGAFDVVLAGSIANYPIYVDSLVNGFQDYSWATNVNFQNPSPVYAGSDSIKVTAAAYTALALYTNFPTTTPYASLSFWINGGAAGASGLQVMGTIPSGSGSVEVNVIDLPPLAPNTWTQFNFSLAELGVAGITNCNGFWFWPTLSGATTFYVDSIQLDYPVNAPTLAWVPAAGKAGMAVVQLGGAPGRTYWLQSSTNLITWTNIGTNVLTSATVNITNTFPPGSSHQFWRVVLP